MRNYPIRLFTLFVTLLLGAASMVQADVLDDVVKRGSLKVGVALFAPWTIKGKDGGLIGFEVDMAEMIAADIGTKAEVILLDWDAMIPALEKGEIDMIAAGMAITPQRALKVNFSQPYMTSGVTLATNLEKTSHITKLEELNQPKVIIASVGETLASSVATKIFDKATKQTFKTLAEAEAAVINGDAHVYVASVPEAQFFVLANPGKLDLPLEKPLVASKAGFAVKKGETELLNVLNAWIVARETDGTIGTAHSYWFRSLAWRSKVQ